MYHTDPRHPDSDYDGVPDGIEIANGTNPAGRDSDNDGLVDGSDPDPLADRKSTRLNSSHAR